MRFTKSNLNKFDKMNYRRQGLVPLLDIFTPVVISEKPNSSIFLPSKFVSLKKSNTERPKGRPFIQRKNKVLSSLLASDISPFLDQSQILKLRPFLKERSNATTKYSFVIDCAVAQDIVNKILPKIDSKESIIIEGNPGLALISLYLIKSGMPEIHIYEEGPLRPLSLNHIIKEHPQKKLKITSSNLFSGSSHETKPIFKVISSKKAKLKKIIIGITPNYSFFSEVVYLILNRNLWDCIHLTEFYVVISFDVYSNIIKFENPNGKYFVHCMFNFIFGTEIMAEYPREAFLPFSKSYHDKMYLIRITKKADNFADIRQEDLPVYMTFIKILGRSRYQFIIPTLEQWLPGCGPYLISKGISLMNQTRDISASESVKLFNLIAMHDGYENLKVLSQNFKADMEI